jgi:LVIVD repeat
MRVRLVVAVVAVTTLLALPVSAAGHGEKATAFGSLMSLSDFNTVTGAGYVATKNMHGMGFTQREAPGTSLAQINSDLAFWGQTAYQGTWSGFRIVDISEPDNPREVLDYRDCAHPSGQGDVVIWNNILVRTWDANANTTGFTCDGQEVPVGFEGLHFFDVSNPQDPVLKGSLDLQCGSHTATGVPDVDNGRLVVYSTPSNGNCPGIDVVTLDLESWAIDYKGLSRASDTTTDPATNIACHDTGVILGSAQKAACAGSVGFAVWDISGDKAAPQLEYVKRVGHNVSVGHSAAFSWDGDTLIFGHEPGGGSQARCQETGVGTQTDDHKSLFFFDVATGEETGKWTLTRAQTAQENCTIHNYNVVPTKGDVLVHGSYQSGIGVLDFSDVTGAEEIAYADPAPLTTSGIRLGGDWSSYWYNGRIYESDIRRGLMVWRYSGPAMGATPHLSHLNPQTQEFTID